MKTYPGTVTSTFIRQGASQAIGTIIDGHLADGDITLLYEMWAADWPAPLEFSGGVKAITCEQVMEVGEAQFVEAFGKKNTEAARRIFGVARNNAGR